MRRVTRALAIALALSAAGSASAVENARPRQVMIEARFAEVRRADVRELGFDWIGPEAQPLDPAKIPVLGALLGKEPKEDAVLATRQATARTGAPAEIEVGDPKTVAVRLLIVPGITAEGHVAMRIEAQVAQPGLSELLDTKIVIPAGQSVAIGGVFTQETREAARGVPGLGGVPVLGTLFRNPSFASGKSDLLILITPYVMGEEGSRRGGTPPSQVFQPRPDPGLERPNVPQAPHQPKPGYGSP